MTGPVIHITRTRYAAMLVAWCDGCNTVYPIWDDPEELAHPCYTECDRCAGEGGPPSHYDDETGRWHHYVCGQCGGSGTIPRWSELAPR
jgi:hypothetical protein